MKQKASLSLPTNMGFEECLQALRQSLRHEGLQVIAEVPFHRVITRDLGLSGRKYTVLIVWNPLLGYWGALSDREVGMFLPIHFAVADNESGTLVSATNLDIFGELAETTAAQVLTEDLSCKIQRVFSELKASVGSQTSPEESIPNLAK